MVVTKVLNYILIIQRNKAVDKHEKPKHFRVFVIQKVVNDTFIVNREKAKVQRVN